MRSHTLSLETQKHTAPTQLPGQILFVEVADPPRLLLGREALLYLGFPVQLFLQKMAEHGFCHDQEPLPLPNMASGQVAKAKKRRAAVSTWLGEQLMMDLAGNAMALPVLLAIMQSFSALVARARSAAFCLLRLLPWALGLDCFRLPCQSFRSVSTGSPLPLPFCFLQVGPAFCLLALQPCSQTPRCKPLKKS